jgi:hypothetical protein
VLIFLLLLIITRAPSRKSEIPTEAGGAQPGNQEPAPKLAPAVELPSEVA